MHGRKKTSYRFARKTVGAVPANRRHVGRVRSRVAFPCSGRYRLLSTPERFNARISTRITCDLRDSWCDVPSGIRDPRFDDRGPGVRATIGLHGDDRRRRPRFRACRSASVQRRHGDVGRAAGATVHVGFRTLRAIGRSRRLGNIAVRHLGFAPRDVWLTLRPGEHRAIEIGLVPVVVMLPAVAVQVSRSCSAPGVPPASSDSAFAAVFEQLRQNADQFRLLATEYPFVSSLDRTFVAELHDGSLQSERRDTIVMRSDHFWPYHPGQVIARSTDVRSGSDYVMHIPTLDVIADSLFLRAHCFTNGGRVEVDGLPRLRVDFRSAASIATPDVDGSMYLDPVTFQIRRSVVRLSRRPRQFPQIDSLEVTTDFDEVYASLSIITTIQSRTRLYTPGRPAAPRAMIERQELVSLAFRAARPGDRLRAPIPQGSIRPSTRAIVAIDSASGFPLANVEIHDPVSDSSARTDANGGAIISFLADSGGVVNVRRVGYAMREIRLPARSAGATAVRIVLSRAVSLPALVANDTARRYISPALNGFEERRRTGVGGYFITDSTLRKEENRLLGDVMRGHIPGAMLAEGPHLANYLLRSPRCFWGDRRRCTSMASLSPRR